DRHIEHVEIALLAQEFERIGCNPQHKVRMVGRHHMQAGELRAAFGLFTRGLEILAMLDKLGAKGLHRAVLLDRIAVRYTDHRRHTKPGRRKGEALAVIAAGRRDDARYIRLLALEPIEIDEP